MPPDVDLRPWAAGDLPLLMRLLGDPAMMTHLGGPESPEKLRARNARYAKHAEPGGMFALLAGPARVPAGSIGYWEKDWRGQTVWETGWLVLPEFQGQGLATAATQLIIARARAERRHRWLHAFPSVHNAASNAICRKTGFTLLGAIEFEYPPDHWMHCHDWQYDLEAA